MIFKDILGYESIYQISNTGVVKRLTHTGKSYQGKSYLKEHILKQEIVKRNHTSYARVSLSKEGKVTRYSVHRLVGLHFIDNPENKPQINHIDNNGLNNNYTNLEWTTHSENMLHASKQGRLPGKYTLLDLADKRSKATDVKISSLLGSSLIKLYTIKSGKRERKYAQYYCKHCSNVADARIDNPRITNQVCVKCINR